MRYSQPLWKIAACSIVLVACGPGMAGHNVSFAPGASAEGNSLIVKNDYFGEVDVFVVTGATRARIGSVRAARTALLRIPPVFMTRTEIQFQIDPVGPEPPFTYRPVSVGDGNTIELAVAPMLQMSAQTIYVNQ